MVVHARGRALATGAGGLLGNRDGVRATSERRPEDEPFVRPRPPRCRGTSDSQVAREVDIILEGSPPPLLYSKWHCTRVASCEDQYQYVLWDRAQYLRRMS